MTDLGATFRDLHRPGDPVLMPNPWDMGTGKLMKAAGAQALGTTSAGVAFAIGHPDGEAVTRDLHLAHAEDLVAATGLPISGDLENGYGDAPEDVAETVRLAAEAGLAGCGIEDTRLPGTEPYAFDLAVERIRAAVAAARALPRDFVLTARTDVTLLGTHGADEAVRRLLAFAEAGADCLFAPMPGDLDAQKRLTAATDVPVNVLAIGDYRALGRSGIAALGAARISIGAGLTRVTAQVVMQSTTQMLEQGDFTPLDAGMPFYTLDPILSR
jgi:2-methylisocitrate lyase-like PEP mutase family enzyme